MNCTQFRKIATQTGHGLLPGEQLPDWEAHLQECADCQQYVFQNMADDAPRSNYLGNDVGNEQADMLTERILQATSGGVENISLQLQALQELQPPDGFTRSVLERTESRRRRRVQQTRWKRAIISLMLRPRIAQEFSFAFTLVIALILGVPTGNFTGQETLIDLYTKIAEPLAEVGGKVSPENFQR